MARLLPPPFEGDFDAEDSEELFSDHLSREAKEALHLRHQIWSAYPQSHSRLNKQCREIYAEILERAWSEEDDLFAEDQPEKPRSWVGRAFKWAFYPDVAETNLGVMFQSVRGYGLVAAVIVAAVALYHSWDDRFPARKESLAWVQMMISEQRQEGAEKEAKLWLYPRWQDPIVIRIEGEDGQRIFSGLRSQLSMLRHLTGLSIALASKKTEKTANVMITYKGHLDRTLEEGAARAELEQGSSATWSVEAKGDDKRFIHTAHIEIDFDVLNAKFGDLQKTSERRKAAETFTLWGLVSCLGLFSRPPREADSLLRASREITPLDGLSLYTLYDPDVPAGAPYEAVADKVVARIDQALTYGSLESLVEHRAAEMNAP